MIYGMYFLKSHSIEYRELGYYNNDNNDNNDNKKNNNNNNNNRNRKLILNKDYKILKKSFHKLKNNKKEVVSVNSNNKVRRSRRLLNMIPEYDGL
tara:strand:+ start:188 stop:472 length:285 start_codon:yes stop_codon:yes gene_type:complete